MRFRVALPDPFNADGRKVVEPSNGRPEALRATLPTKSPKKLTLVEKLTLPPGAMPTELGEMLIAKPTTEGRSPYTTTAPSCVATYTLPFTTVGATNFES